MPSSGPEAVGWLLLPGHNRRACTGNKNATGLTPQCCRCHVVFLCVQTLGCDGLWVIEFDHPVSILGCVPSQRQLVCSLDMVNHTRAPAHSLLPGDAVLSPWEPDLRRYGPGRVMKVTTEDRDRKGGVWSHLPSQNGKAYVCCVIYFVIPGDSSVRVQMWNTCVFHLQAHLVLTISANHHDRIVKELHISTSHRCHFGSCRCCCSPLCSLHHRCDTTDRFNQPAASSSSLCEDETRLKLRPAENLGSRGQQPPWRYWRRTGAEPQHRQPGEQNDAEPQFNNTLYI